MNSPTLFDEGLAQDLIAFRQTHPEVTLLQYVDDLLAAELEDQCIQATHCLLQTFTDLGYWISAKEAQLCTHPHPPKKNTYLGYNLKGGKRTLFSSQIQVILKIPTPTMKWWIWEFFGAAVYCYLWILCFAEIAKPLLQLEVRTWTKVDRGGGTSVPGLEDCSGECSSPELARNLSNCMWRKPKGL